MSLSVWQNVAIVLMFNYLKEIEVTLQAFPANLGSTVKSCLKKKVIKLTE
jgi:hypothetical protein